MDGNRVTGRVTNLAGEVDREGQIVGYRGIGTMIDPGPYRERPGLDERLASAIDGLPDLVDDQIAGVRRMLTRAVVA